MTTIDPGAAAENPFDRPAGAGRSRPLAADRFEDWNAFDAIASAFVDSRADARTSLKDSDPQPMADFPAVISLATLDGSNGFRLAGIDAFDRSGRSVSFAGDVNGDGIDDIIIGASGAEDAGESYLIFGKAGSFAATFDLAALDGINGFRIDGAEGGDQSGHSVSDAGDVNGDGFDDIIINARSADVGGRFEAGASYVVFGKAEGFGASFDLAALDGSNGIRLDGVSAFDRGGPVSSAGDVNGDGFDDVIIGVPNADVGNESSAGESYVVFGSDAGIAASLNLASLDGTNGFRLDGADQFDNAGSSVSSAGDFNGDGFGDLIIGASGAEAYIVFGMSSGFAPALELATLDGVNGFRFEGFGNYVASSVSSAGDVNGDGLDDIIIGEDYGRAGVSYVVFGRTGGFASSLDLATLDGSNGFRVDGEDRGDASGSSVSGAGDVNGDGFDDILIGAPGGLYVYDRVGESYVVFGKAGGFDASIDLAALDGSNGFRLEGIGSDDRSGSAVSAAGDINSDGFDDIIIGAQEANPLGAQLSGESYVVFGRAPSEAVKRIGSAADQEIRGGDFDDTLAGRGGDDALFGGAGGDQLAGGGGRDTLAGGGGDDQLIMSAGGDRMKGGAGADAFTLTDDLADVERAVIVDFTSGNDLFAIDAGEFGGGLTPGALNPDAFFADTSGQAQDAEDRFIYDTDSGKLFYDADGNGAGESVLIAKLNDAPTIDAGDFLVI